MNRNLTLSLLFGLVTLDNVEAAIKGKDGEELYNYVQNGADWGERYPECNLTNQSPINLQTTQWSFYRAASDNFQKIYTNQVGDIEVAWTDYTTQVAVNKAGQDLQTFSSQYAKNELGASERFTGVQFHFHAGSEHTIDQKRYDLEMHTVHIANDQDKATESGVGFAALGIMFSVNDYTKLLQPEQQHIIDVFFDSMHWDELVVDDGHGKDHKSDGDPKDGHGDDDKKDGDGDHSDDKKAGRRLADSLLPKYKNPVVDEVAYGDLMNMVDTERRWVYEGSVTTPPCAKTVYWNVVQQVYPIKKRHFDLYIGQLERGAHSLHVTGNWRTIQPYDNHNAQIMVTPEIEALLVEKLLKEYQEFNKFYQQTAIAMSASKTVNQQPFVSEVEVVPQYYNLLVRTKQQEVKSGAYEAAYLGKAVAKQSQKSSMQNQLLSRALGGL